MSDLKDKFAKMSDKEVVNECNAIIKKFKEFNDEKLNTTLNEFDKTMKEIEDKLESMLLSIKVTG